ncbi:MAG TPA: phosphatase PAP2 family protein [Actinocrinis sp.]|nr:phosphatase PAP2 family protein [Actinocrinis sp.]
MSSAAPAYTTITSADDGWYRAIATFAQQTPWLHGAMSFYTTAAIFVLALMTIYSWTSARGRSDELALAAATWTCFGSLISVACGLGLKQLFHETRPCLFLNVATVQSCPGPADYSFPSDHTTFAAAIALGLWLTNRRLGAIALALALLEGFSRIYLGLHYPHDVIAGFALSAAVMLGAWPLARRPLTTLMRTREPDESGLDHVRSAHDRPVGGVQGIGHR